MATIKEIIYTIRALRYDSHTPDDFAISDARLQHFVDVERSFLLKQYLDKDRIVPKQVEQVIECLPLECIDISSCIDCGFAAEEYILRTPELPKPINYNFATDSAAELFTGISTPVGTPIEFTSQAIAYWGAHSKYSKKMPRAYYKNNRLYFTNVGDLKFVQIKGVFENPAKLAEFNTCTGEVCFDEETTQYPILDYHLSLIYSTIMQKYIIPAIQMPHDKKNNAAEIER